MQVLLVQEGARLSWGPELPGCEWKEALPSCEARSSISEPKRMMSRGSSTAAKASLQLRVMSDSPMVSKVQFLIKKPAQDVGAIDRWEYLVRQSAEKVVEVLYWCLCVEREG